MTTTLPRKDELDIVPTMFIRPQRPEDHRQFEQILPWWTPLFVYQMEGKDWVRWSVPRSMGMKMGLGQGCSCCGEDQTEMGDMEDFHVDTAWSETDWWLLANGYARPALPEGPESRTEPTEEEGTQS